MEIISDLRKFVMRSLTTVLIVFVTSPKLMVPSSVQDFVLYTLCAILLCHLVMRVLFSAKTLVGYLTAVSTVAPVVPSWYK